MKHNESNNLTLFLITGQLYGLEKFWAFMKYYKNADRLTVDKVLKEYLSKFKAIEDFRVVEPKINEMLQGVGNLNKSKFLHRYRSRSESEGVTDVVNNKYNRPNTTITNRSDYIGPQGASSSRNQYQHQLQSQPTRGRTGLFGPGPIRVRSGSVGNQPQVVGRSGSKNDLAKVQSCKTTSASASATSTSTSSIDRKTKSEK